VGSDLLPVSTSTNKPAGADWTKLLADPEIASHLGELLQAYREAPADKRDQALIEAMRRIKGKPEPGSAKNEAPQLLQAVATAPSATPPFEPDIFTPSWGEDRRRYPRMKCFVAVELRQDGSPAPVWGNLVNTSLGGCFVETVTSLDHGAKLGIGLWIASGKIWVKGLVLNGIVTRTSPSFGIRVKFVEMEPTERATLRQFLKFVENATKGYHYEAGYLARLKR
jgi:PilZ domain